MVETTESTLRYDINDKNANSPVIVNNTEYPIVVFLERGVLYNKKALLPGEAVSMTKKETGILLPYKVHAVLGDESALPSRADSIKNLAKVSSRITENKFMTTKLSCTLYDMNFKLQF